VTKPNTISHSQHITQVKNRKNLVYA